MFFICLGTPLEVWGRKEFFFFWQEGKCDRPGHCGIENSSWEGRENRGPGGREGDTGTDRNIDEGGEDENDGEGERKTGERRRETEKREEKMKAEGEGTREGVERK